jgi:hypothetical protein
MIEHNVQPVSDSFDQDYGQSTNHLSVQDHHNVFPQHHDITSLTHHHGLNSYDSSNDFLNYQDPLKHAYKHQFQPLTLDIGNTHFVNPHHVNGYIRNDGTYVEGYYRDGDGNTAINRPVEAGGGYFSGNPDGNPFNNLK